MCKMLKKVLGFKKKSAVKGRSVETTRKASAMRRTV